MSHNGTPSAPPVKFRFVLHFSLSPPRVAFLAWVDFHARSRFTRSTIPEEQWGTTRSLVFSQHPAWVITPVKPLRGGALGYFLGGYVPPGTPNWHPVLKKIPLKLIPSSRNGPIPFQ